MLYIKYMFIKNIAALTLLRVSKKTQKHFLVHKVKTVNITHHLISLFHVESEFEECFRIFTQTHLGLSSYHNLIRS